MLPTPGMGHLIPLIGFAKDLVQSHDLAITLIVLTIGPPTNAQKDLLHALPGTIKPILVPPVSSQPEMNAFVAITRSMSSIRHVFKSLVDSNRPRELVVDLLTTDVLDVAMEFNIPSYVYFPSSALSLALMFDLPTSDETVSYEFRDLPEPMKLPGSVPVHGMILNSFKDLEPGTIEALQLEEPDKPAVYAIGPRLQTGSSGGIDESECALGLEMSEQRFLWVILGHGSTGGFLTHCGWNSVLESIANGVPMIAWPLYAEQRMNAVLLTEGINVALRPTVNQKDQGLIIREEMSKYKDAAAKAVSEMVKWKEDDNI
ncbi:hypothetical protein E1A91_A11G106200v1 [Gossypium mustelinum]|uniref:UDP-glycosyltransferases domain-containing protein n=1 Tax=Gossypium mustelinum TaxID=34275 RepID=A0A5D2X4X7_GOSMU|nr:hypothetical protein E1A91_A11G106200v1 [Gossypium mustelinum]